jgi:hypothetical protein
MAVTSRLSLGLSTQEAPIRLRYSWVCLAELRSSAESLSDTVPKSRPSPLAVIDDRKDLSHGFFLKSLLPTQ